jgi:hypothetical protein
MWSHKQFTSPQQVMVERTGVSIDASILTA